MHSEMTETNIKLTATFNQLVTMAETGQVVLATPNTSGKINNVYVGSQRSFVYDFVCATPSDFESCGIRFGGWEDLSEEEFDSVADDEYSVTISRIRQDDSE